MKIELVQEFNAYIRTSLIASSDLETFKSEIEGAIRFIFAADNWTKKSYSNIPSGSTEFRGATPAGHYYYLSNFQLDVQRLMARAKACTS